MGKNTSPTIVTTSLPSKKKTAANTARERRRPLPPDAWRGTGRGSFDVVISLSVERQPRDEGVLVRCHRTGIAGAGPTREAAEAAFWRMMREEGDVLSQLSTETPPDEFPQEWADRLAYVQAAVAWQDALSAAHALREASREAARLLALAAHDGVGGAETAIELPPEEGGTPA